MRVSLLKFGTVFGMAVICALAVVTSSSGLSQFNADRGVYMQIANSGDAFISLPETIIINMNILRITTNYYKEEVNRNSKIKGQTTDRKLVKTETTMTITETDHNLMIKNNMDQAINVQEILFHHPQLQFHNSGLILDAGMEQKIDISNDFISDDYETLQNTTIESNANLHFKWNNGQTTVFKQVLINVTFTDNTVEQVVEE